MVETGRKKLKKNEKFVVAVKDVSSGGIKPGKVLGTYRTIDFARNDFYKLAGRAGLVSWKVGIFKEKIIVN